MTVLTDEIAEVAKVGVPQNYHCHSCNKSFHLDSHLRVHSCVQEPPMQEKPLSCDLCKGEKFDLIDELKEHLKIHAKALFGENVNPNQNAESLDCDVCGKTLSSKNTLKRHKLSHTTEKAEKKHDCKTCGKILSSNASLMRHEKLHTRENKSVSLTCPDCNKKFVKEHTFKAHVLTHTNPQTYDCPECGKNFLRKYNMTKHLRTHTK